MLFLPVAETEKVAGQLSQAEPLIGQLATDPSLRGLIEVLQFGLTGVELEKITLDAMLRPLTATADTVEAVLADQPVHFSWHEMLAGDNPEANSKRKFIDIQPMLDFTALEPGKDATDAIRQAATDLKLPTEYGARVRLTGPVADRRRGIRDREGGHAAERHRHRRDRAGHPLARAEVGAHHPGGVHQHARSGSR